MSDSKWEMFFNLLKEMVDEGRPFSDKIADLRHNAKEYAAITYCEEFASWCDDTSDWPN